MRRSGVRHEGAPAIDPAEDATLDHHTWRRTLASAWVAQALAIMGFSFCMPFTRLYLRDELGVVDEIARARWAGFISAALPVVMFFSAPLWGIIADRVGRKVMVMRAMFGGAVVVGLMGAATSPWHLLFLRMAQGAITGTITASAALVSGVTPGRRIGFSMGMLQGAVFAGNAVGPLVGGACVDHFGYRTTFYIASVMLIGGGVFVTALAREGTAHPRLSAYGHLPAGRAGAQGGEAPTQGRRGDAHSPGHGLVEILRGPGFAVFVGVLFVMNFSRMMPAPLFQEYVEMLHGETSGVNTRVGVLISTRSAVAAFTSMAMGWLAMRVSLTTLIAGATFSAGVLAVPLAFAGSTTQVLLLQIGLGFASGMLGPALGRLVHSSVPRESHGQAYGLVQSANSAGVGLGPLTGGLLNAELTRAYGRGIGLRTPYAVAGAFQILVGLACWLALRPRSTERRPARAGRPL